MSPEARHWPRATIPKVCRNQREQSSVSIREATTGSLCKHMFSNLATIVGLLLNKKIDVEGDSGEQCSGRVESLSRLKAMGND